MKEFEVRGAAVSIEVRALDGADPVVIGYAAVFGALSEDLGGFREQIAPGAFKNGIGGDIRALFNHDPNLILGRTKSGTLTVAEDTQGLRVEFTPPNTATARHIVESMRRGDVSQMSFAFRTLRDHWEERNGEIIRTLLDVEVRDVSPVTYPAYPQTEVAVRSLGAFKAQQAPDPSLGILQLRRRLAIAAA